MRKHKFLIFLSSLMAFVALSWGPDLGWAQSNVVNKARTDCTIKGKYSMSCTAGQLKQAAREAARQNAARQKTGVNKKFAVSPTTAPLSPLATGAPSLATMAPPYDPPDYFGVGNYANSPLPTIAGGIISGGMQKFVNTLPLLTPAGANNLGTYIPLAVADTSTFPGSDFYRIGLKEYTHPFHGSLPATNIRGYFDMGNALDPANHYLGPLILATRNRPVRILFNNQLATDLNVPVDSTYMGAGAISDGTNSVAKASERRATLHLHGGATPWISDGTPHQWITPASDTTALNANGFAKGYSFEHVPDMVGPLALTNNLKDGKATFYWTNQQSGRLLFYHDHAYGITRLNVYAGEAAGYLLVDGVEEAALRAATAPGTIPTINDPTNALDPFGNPSQIPDLANADLGHIIPLVIQDKTFVPDPAPGGQLAAQDPMWDIAKWGGLGSLWFPHVYTPNQNPADITGANGFGRWDWGPWFWPPQNPASLLGQPYQCTSAAYPNGAGLAFPPLMCPGVPFWAPNETLPPTIPNSPSGTPEAFMDTPVVNGTAYPTLTVAPSAYRFQVLNAANDRALNLGLYVAEPVTLSPIITSPGSGYTAPTVAIGGCTGGTAIAIVGDGPIDPTTGLPTFTAGIVGITMTSQPSACTAPAITISDPGAPTSLAAASVVMSQNTDVKMVPAIPVTAGRALPNCSQAAPMAGGGQVTALLDASGNPLNGTGLPANCWPLYSSAQGYTAGPFGENGGRLSWGNSDARTGGIPDPTTAGPPIIQIGAEGGLLPKVAVIPSTPISYDYNKRSITVLNVLNHGLWLGPAERADIIIDFSNPMFAGKTLILYNDAPAPVPAGDPRLDYYTNNPDQSDTGGAPSTLAGYGPNMRTIMQINVTGSNPNTTTFSLPALSAALPTIFSQTQDAVIIPQSVYPVGHGNGPDTYLPIQATSINAFIGGPIGGITLTSGGAGYTTAPSVTLDPPPSPCPGGLTCTQATATANLAPTSLSNLALTSGGSGYASAPAVTFTGGGGSGAAATAALAPTSVGSISLTNGGFGYSSAPVVTIGPPNVAGGTQATATATVRLRRVYTITLTNPGSGYTSAPTVNITGGGGSGARANTTLAPAAVGSLTLTNAGSGYTSQPTVTIAPPPTGTPATAAVTLAGSPVASVTVTNPGSGYTSVPAVTFAASPLGGASTATAVATAPTVPLLPKTIQELFTLDYGRMNATLGVEVPFTNFLTQTTIPYGYVDPPTEIFKDGETQLWKITHNGVDTHFIHFHLFTVQVINRVGWDGAIKPPDPYELGLKDTVRMNPLEDIIVALRPFQQTLPFPVPNSYRLMDTTRPLGSALPNEFTNIDPTNQPAAVTNSMVNFGWEYVWHCHILGHEENDMMRAMILAVAPGVPPAPTATLGGTNIRPRITVALSATAVADTAVPSGFTIQRAVVTGGVPGAWSTVGSVAATISGITANASFTDTTPARRTSYVYRAIANNLVGYTQTYAAPAVGYPNVSSDSLPSGQSNTITTR